MPASTGKVYLIGAGPGDPGLLTLRGRRLLRQADLVLYDYLANPRILQFTGPGAEMVCLGRHGQSRLLTQTEIHERMIAAARQGKMVARLKGGDPAIFGRTAEETAALEAEGIPYEIVPGVTSAQAASSYAGIPLTHRDAASCVALVTGQQSRDEGVAPLDMAALARFPGTLVFYMGVTSAPQWATELVAQGKPPGTPVAVVRHASLPKQQTIVTTLGELPGVIAKRKLRPPAVIIVGESVSARAGADWFASRPLFGRTVLVTRPAHQADALGEQFEELGANVLIQPAIAIGPPLDWAPVDRAIARMREFDWIVFSSVNGVEYFLDRLEHLKLDARAMANARLAAIGPATAEALAGRHLRADLEPPEYRAEALADSLLPAAAGKRVLLVRASRGREVLAETLSAGGADVTQAVAYESRDVTALNPEVAAALDEGVVDWITVTSSAIARSLAALLGDRLNRAMLAAISPLTAEVLGYAGYQAEVTAKSYTTAGLVEAILEAERRA